jgi:hypothetical protein
MKRVLTVAVLALALLSAAVRAADREVIWVEAESGTDKVEHTNDWYTPVDKKTSLSGHEWWHSFDEPNMSSGYVVCPFDVPEGGKYRLWIRLDRSSTGYRWALDGARPAELPVEKWRREDHENRGNIKHERRIFDETFAAHDGSNRHRLLWVKGPMLELKAGKHTVRFEVLPGKDNKGFAAVDCFVLSPEGFEFRPRMHYKPGERVQTVDELPPGKSWPAYYRKDTFDPTPIDLRRLNEATAGEHGFIRLSKDGESFVRGDGTPIRFWAGSDYSWRQPFRDGNLLVSPTEEAEVAHHVRWMAKRGINMVRYHGHLPPKPPRGSKKPVKRTDINVAGLHGAWYMVASFKREGIYSTISPYWGSHTDNEPGWDLGFEGGNLAGLVFFYEPVQEMYKGWVRRLFTETNPYTGIPLKDDPALAIIQIQNEDSLLFYTEARIQGEPRQVLLRKFGDFLAEKYGSLETALKRYRSYETAWDLRGEDSVEKGTAGLLQMWFHTLDAKNRAQKWDPPTRRRLDDQLEFYTTLMRDFNAEMERFLRDELGCKQLINAGNWKSVDPVTADDAERYSYTPNEVIGRNAYYGSVHAGINVGWQILTQQSYTNWSSLERPRFWPMNVKQVVGHPFIIPESLWVPPNLYKSEAPLVVAAQCSLTGVDVFYWFACGAGEWGDLDGKWAFNTPMQMGQFPATALAFRERYIDQAEQPVVYEERSLEDIWQQKTPLIAESATWDPNRDKGEMPVESPVKTPVDSLAFCTGPVKVRYGGDAKNNRLSPQLDELIDTENKHVRSVTGQIALDYGKGVYTVDAPRCQGAAGFLATTPEIKLGDTVIRCGNDYATIVVVPIDGKPIASSRKVLVQVGTVARPRGWIARERAVVAGEKEHDGFQILDKGGPPLMIANTDATLTIANPDLNRAVALDLNGQPTGAKVAIARRGRTLHVTLPPDALYTVLSAE